MLYSFKARLFRFLTEYFLAWRVTDKQSGGFLYRFMFPVAGGLVKKILETKKELEGGSLTQQGKAAKKTEIVSHLHLT